MFFGKKLKEIRIEKSFGGHKLAKEIEMCPSELSRIEHGWVESPIDLNWMRKIIYVLHPNKEDKLELLDLWVQPFYMEKMSEDIIAIFPIDSNTHRCITNSDRIEKFNEYLVNIAKKHNKKADKYNMKKIFLKVK